MTLSKSLDRANSHNHVDPHTLKQAGCDILEDAMRLMPERGSILRPRYRRDSLTFFNVIYHADKTRTFHESGVGLSITRHFLELLYAHIEVDSTPEEGSAHRIILPFKAISES